MTEGAPSTIEISVPLDGEAAEAVCALFQQHGGGAVVETIMDGRGGQPEHWVRTYLAASDADARARIEVGLWHLSQIYPIPEAAVRPLAEANWAEAWKQHYSPLRIGRRFLVSPSWIDVAAAPGEIVVRLDPGMAFGTGLHPTTQLCLAALEAAVRPGARVLDVGTGSGILAIGALLLGAASAVAVDIDAQASETASANAALNGVRLHSIAGRIQDAPAGAYDVVVANLLASTVTELAGDMSSRTRPGGCVIASGILADQAPAVTTALTAAGLGNVAVRTSGDWVALVAERPAIVEPMP